MKTVGNASVLVGDVGHAKDAQQIQTNIVRVDGQRSVYLPILKQGGDSNTIAVVDGIQEAAVASGRHSEATRRQGCLRSVGLREGGDRESAS